MNFDVETKKLLPSRKQRLTYVDWDYNNVDTAPDLSGIRHKAFIPGDGPTIRPEVVFLLKCPTRIETMKGNILDGIHFKLIKSFCEDVGIEDYYATYFIKYELAQGRIPRPLEAQAALRYVREELTILEPAITVLVGEDMHNIMFPTLSFNDAYNKLIVGKKGLYYSVPDVLLARRNWNAYADVADEFFVLKDILDALM